MKKKFYLTGLLAFAAATATQAQTKFGDNKASINPGSVLELESTNKGMLLPRVALSDRLVWGLNGATPVKGMVVYNTNPSGANGLDTGMLVWQGRWNPIGNAGSSPAGNYWRLDGNAGTTAPTTIGTAVGAASYWGTTDAQNLAVGTNGTTRAIFDQSGSLYGGNATYDATLNPLRSLVWGENNKDSASYTLVSGQNNKLGPNAANSVVGGSGHVLAGSYGNAVFGNVDTIATGGENILGGFGNRIGGTQNLVEGSSNKVTGNQNLVSGGNNIVNASNATVSGVYNSDSANYTLIAGASNTIGSAGIWSTVTGAGNSEMGNSGLISGFSNNDTGWYDIIAGQYNICEVNSQWCAVFGERNRNGNGDKYNLIVGSRNIVTGFPSPSWYAIVGGRANTVMSSNGSLVSGMSNIVTNAPNTVVGGSNDTVYAMHSAVFGKGHKDSSSYSLVAGMRNNLSAGMPYAAVFGKNSIPVDSALLVVGNGYHYEAIPTDVTTLRSNAITVSSTIPTPNATANNATLNVNGSLAMAISAVTSNYTLTNADYKILVRTSGTAHITLTLPAPATCTGRIYLVQNMNASGGGAKFNYPIEIGNGATIPTGTPALTGAVTGSSYYAGATLLLQSDGTAWTAITF